MKICVIFTGGTIGSAVQEDGFFAPDGKTGYKLIEMFREYNTSSVDVEFVTREPYRMLSEQLDEASLNLLIRSVSEAVREGRAQDYDGIIVTHGTDTLQYSASALGLTLGFTELPVVLVSSNYMLEDERMNGLDNFAGAVDFIRWCREHENREYESREHECMGEKTKGVFVAYQNAGEAVWIHRGTRLLSHRIYEDQLYSLGGPVGYVENHQFIDSQDSSCQETKNCLELTELPSLEKGNVFWMHIHPMAVYQEMKSLVSMGVKAILITTYHSGTLCTANKAFREFVFQAKENHIPVFLVGASEEAAYVSKKEFAELGLQSLGRMTNISAYMKLTIGIANGIVEEGELRRFMSSCIEKEILPFS